MKILILCLCMCLSLIIKPIRPLPTTETRDSYTIENFETVLQNPELPTGCEVTSLTAVLNYLGYEVDKVTMANEYLPKMNFYRKDGKLYGTDFRYVFAGTPFNNSSYGCYAPCIMNTANAYLKYHQNIHKAIDVSGREFTDLEFYINNNMPVIVWATSENLKQPKLTTKWTTPSGENVQWLSGEHCMVLIGYDKINGTVTVADPLVGLTTYPYELFKTRYEQMGKQAVVIRENLENYAWIIPMRQLTYY